MDSLEQGHTQRVHSSPPLSVPVSVLSINYNYARLSQTHNRLFLTEGYCSTVFWREGGEEYRRDMEGERRETRRDREGREERHGVI